MSRRLIWVWVYVLPVPLCLAMYPIWLSWSGSRAFALFVMLLPVLYGYVIPGIGTNILKKWRFKGAWLVGNYYVHHGFMYAANMAPPLFFSFLGTSRESVSPATAIRVVLCTGVSLAFLLWIHDILIVKHDMVEIYNRPAAEGRSPEEIVTFYAPLCFFLLGATYGAASVLAFETFVARHSTNWLAVLCVWAAGVALTFSIPSLAYRFLEGRKASPGSKLATHNAAVTLPEQTRRET